MAELSIQQKNIIKELKQAHPELANYSDEQILTIYNDSLSNIRLSENERISILTDSVSDFSDMGLKLEKSREEFSEELTPTQINDLKNNLKSRINAVSTKTAEAEKSNGFIGKAWNWTKNNLLDWCTDSTNDIKKAQEADLKALESGNIKTAFKQITGLDYTVDNVNKFLNNEIKTTSEQALDGYKEGQEMAVDFAGDLVSGIAAVGFYSAAVATGGASILLGLGVATAIGGGIKSAIKFGDAKSAGSEYNTFGKDLLTGGFSGLIAPITGGLGGAIGKTVATKLGINAIKAGAGNIVEQSLKTGVGSTLKTALVNPTGYEYVGGNIVKKGLALGAEMMTDGALSGTLDGGFRAGVENDWDTNAMLGGAVEGGIGGTLMAPVVGGGFKLSGKAGHKIGEKVNLPSLSSLKANFEYLKFKRNYDPAKNNKYWKALNKGEDFSNFRLKSTKNLEFEAFKREVSEIESSIRKYSDYYAGLGEKERIIKSANNFREKWNKTRVGQLEEFSGINQVQLKYIDTILSSWKSEEDIFHALSKINRINSPQEAYFYEQLFFKNVGYARFSSIEITTPAQLAIILKNLDGSHLDMEYALRQLTTPEQIYLSNKENHEFGYVEVIKDIKTDDDFNLLNTILSNKSKDVDDYAYQNLVKLGIQPEFKSLIHKLATNTKLFENENFLKKISWGLSSKETSQQAKTMLSYILSDKRLQDAEFLKKHSYRLFNSKTPEEAQNNIFALNYIFDHKELSNNLKNISAVFDRLTRAKSKENIEAKTQVLDFILSKEKLAKNDEIIEKIPSILRFIDNKEDAKNKINVISYIISDSRFAKNPEYIPWLIDNADYIHEKAFSMISQVIKEMVPDKAFQMYKTRKDGSDIEILNNIFKCMRGIPNKETIKNLTEIAKVAITNPDLAKHMDVLNGIDMVNKNKILDIIRNRRKYQIPEGKVKDVISMFDKFDFDDYSSVVKRYGYENVKAFSDEEFKLAVLFNSLYKKSNINEIPIYEKKKILRNLVFMNAGLFNTKTEMIKDFPLIPKSADEYCDLLPTLVRSLGIETNRIPSEKIVKFNQALTSLSKNLSDIADSDFSKLSITQKYPKDAFIKDVFRIVKDMPAGERQKVYDYFGFELQRNRRSETGFSIAGYPVNLNNGKKLAQISDPNTKAIVEELRPYVVKFSERNSIKSNNPQVEQLLNDIVEVLPEMRTTIGKKQHKTQKFDIMQHSLKVMQKISQDSDFKKLNDSDKKLMILASLLHDITKSEGYTDNTHALNSSFDAFYIGKKLGLAKDESEKLYALIKHHEWLEYVNTARDKDGKVDIGMITKRLQSVAYDLQQDNLFDMAMIFTHADLRAVKPDDSFHDAKVGARGRTDAAGAARSYGNLAEDYGKIIRSYIHELKKSQPLLPHVTMSKASKVAKAITRVNSDGSTNLKGVYVDSKDGLIVIKFNEATDKTWEAIGMPKGSSSQTTQVNIKTSKNGPRETVDVGNINFIVHGLDYENQLVNFDAFSLKDSDALLSVSYTERPRDKYRFFRAQGITLKAKTKYIHGGGQTDSGSGCKKGIEEFKNRYVFGGEREEDRLFFSKLVKEATGMNDEEYIKFVEKNANKPMSKIEPADVRDKIIAIYAEINSAFRKNGDRSYNECYVSNVEASAPFAYPEYGSVGNPINFLNEERVAERTAFLRKYAHDNNEVFIVFGD